ncbi:MAG: hypothetical protein EOO05_16955 [Chitinophagaceae bacterium]|nr:MAG: hypothetical protein EOO05_16955 [Chitinophagaceae bacterium]
MTTWTEWNPAILLLHTKITGKADFALVRQWETSLRQAVDSIPDNAHFRVLADLHGFEAASFDVHKYFRTIIPETMAGCGWRVGYLGLFSEADNLPLKNIRNLQCIAAAHVHHDESKINTYQERFGHSREQFFTDPKKALQWLITTDMAIK